MTLQEFLDQCVGKWFSQRTSHALPPQELEAGKADLWIEVVESGDADTIAACDRAGIEASTAIALRSRWEGQSGIAGKKTAGSTLLVFGAGGAFVQTSSGDRGTTFIGTHALGDDDALMIHATANDVTTAERIWFASENLRERTSTVTHGEAQYASFCSEIRLIPLNQ